MAFRSDLRGWRPGHLRGHVFDEGQPDRRWVVSLTVNGQPVAHALSDADSTDAPAGTPPDCGFAFDLNLAACDPDDIIAVSVANTPSPLASLRVGADEDWQPPAARAHAGEVRHAGGLVLTGTLDGGVTAAPSYEVLAFDGDRIVGRTRIYGWQHIADPASAVSRAVAFQLLLDPTLADGIPRRLRVETSTGMPVGPGAVEVVVWPDRLRQAAQKMGMAGLAAERWLSPQVQPLESYAALYPGLSRLAAQRADDVRLADGGTLRPMAGGWVMVHHAAVTPLAHLPASQAAAAGAAMVIFDLAVRHEGAISPLLWPAFDAERALEQGYPALLMLIPAAVADAALQSGAASVFAVMLHALRGLNPATVLHVPHPGGVLDADGLAGASGALSAALVTQGHDATPCGAYGLPAVHLKRQALGLAVSVIIPVRGRGAVLAATVAGLEAANSGMALDLLIVDDGRTDPATLAALEADGARVLEYEGADSPALMANLAADHARHDLLCLMQPALRFPQAGVLAELAGRLSGGAAAAGPLVTWPSGQVRHGGWALGRHGAHPALTDRMADDTGPQGLLQVAHEVAGLSDALMLLRAGPFRDLGGFDDRVFPAHLHDLDLCLRLWAAGHRVVLSPHLPVVLPPAAGDRPHEGSPAARLQARAADLFRQRWAQMIAADPFGHPLLHDGELPYRHLSAAHRGPEPRRRTVFRGATLPGWIR